MVTYMVITNELGYLDQILGIINFTINICFVFNLYINIY